MQLAKIINHFGAFEIIANDLANDERINALETIIPKAHIVELIKAKPQSNNFNSELWWFYPWGKKYMAHAGLVTSGEDNGVITHFTTDNELYNGTNADTSKFHAWVKEHYLVFLNTL